MVREATTVAVSDFVALAKEIRPGGVYSEGSFSKDVRPPGSLAYPQKRKVAPGFATEQRAKLFNESPRPR
jgi:hypothetical protein